MLHAIIHTVKREKCIPALTVFPIAFLEGLQKAISQLIRVQKEGENMYISFESKRMSIVNALRIMRNRKYYHNRIMHNKPLTHYYPLSMYH